MADGPSATATWQEDLPLLVGAIGDKGFGAALDRALERIAPFDLSCIFAYPGHSRPMLLHDGLKGVSPPVVMHNYLNGTYLLDAVYIACTKQTRGGLYRLKNLAPDAFFEGEYYNSPDVHPCISMLSGSLTEEIVFLIPATRTFYFAYSLLRSKSSAAFRDAEMAALAATEPMVAALVRRHWAERMTAEPPPAAGGTTDAAAVAEQAFRSFQPSKLTLREQEIVGLILRGHSSLSIGNVLAIAEGTVKNHRKHIYAKLAISSQTELFNMFIKHLLSHGG